SVYHDRVCHAFYNRFLHNEGRRFGSSSQKGLLGVTQDYSLAMINASILSTRIPRGLIAELQDFKSYGHVGISLIIITLLKLSGKEIAVLMEGDKPAGRHTCLLNTSGLPSGIYFYTITCGSAAETRKLILLK
ncbi:MAG: hypothetical protein ACM3Q2_01135, partial [Syntrophothermus sp.]